MYLSVSKQMFIKLYPVSYLDAIFVIYSQTVCKMIEIIGFWKIKVMSITDHRKLKMLK